MTVVVAVALVVGKGRRFLLRIGTGGNYRFKPWGALFHAERRLICGEAAQGRFRRWQGRTLPINHRGV